MTVGAKRRNFENFPQKLHFSFNFHTRGGLQLGVARVAKVMWRKLRGESYRGESYMTKVSMAILVLCPTLKPNKSLFYGEEGLFYDDEGLMMPDWPEEGFTSSSFFSYKNLWKLQVYIITE